MRSHVVTRGRVPTGSWSTPRTAFRSRRGQVASLHASWTQWKNLFSFEVFGERGALIVEGLGGTYGSERLSIHRRSEAGPAAEEHLEFAGPDRSWEAEWEDFLAAIRNGHAPPVEGEDALAALRLVEAVYEAARSGAVVRVEAPVGSVAVK